MKKLFSNQKGFTILELLTVIAILGLLASITLVALKDTRERARVKGLLQFGASIYHSTEDSLIYWNFDNVSGTNVPDVSGNGHNGTISGIAGAWDTISDIVNGKAIREVVAPFCIMADNIELKSGSGTFEFWMKPTNPMGMGYTFQLVTSAALCGVNPSNFGMLYNIPGGEYILYLTREDDSICEFDFSDTSIQLNRWNHLAFSYNGSKSSNQGTFYLNAKNIPYSLVSCAGAGKIKNNYEKVMVNLNSSMLSLDEFRLYDAPLTTSEIKQLYAEGLERHKELAER